MKGNSDIKDDLARDVRAIVSKSTGCDIDSINFYRFLTGNEIQSDLSAKYKFIIEYASSKGKIKNMRSFVDAIIMSNYLSVGYLPKNNYYNSMLAISSADYSDINLIRFGIKRFLDDLTFGRSIFESKASLIDSYSDSEVISLIEDPQLLKSIIEGAVPDDLEKLLIETFSMKNIIIGDDIDYLNNSIFYLDGKKFFKHSLKNDKYREFMLFFLLGRKSHSSFMDDKAHHRALDMLSAGDDHEIKSPELMHYNIYMAIKENEYSSAIDMIRELINFDGSKSEFYNYIISLLARDDFTICGRRVVDVSLYLENLFNFNPNQHYWDLAVDAENRFSKSGKSDYSLQSHTDHSYGSFHYRLVYYFLLNSDQVEEESDMFFYDALQGCYSN